MSNRFLSGRQCLVWLLLLAHIHARALISPQTQVQCEGVCIVMLSEESAAYESCQTHKSLSKIERCIVSAWHFSV